jgi:hypothetical protein
MANSEMKENFQLRGHTRIWKNDELVFDKDNAIVNGSTLISSRNGLKAYLAQTMFGGTVVGTPGTVEDCAIDNLFDTSDTGTPPSNSNYMLSGNGAIAAAFDDHDGIIIAAIDAPLEDCFAMITTNVAKTQNYGRKWKGVFTATGARQFSLACIGHGLITNSTELTGITEMFDTPYANQTFTTVVLATNDVLTIEWEIYIA